jgi:hypothetical protein
MSLIYLTVTLVTNNSSTQAIKINVIFNDVNIKTCLFVTDTISTVLLKITQTTLVYKL